MITLADLDEFMPPSNADGTSFQPTEEGNKALTQGSEIYKKYNRRGFFGVPPPRQDDIDRYGGKETLKLWFGTFYCRMFQDPRMNVLFDVRHEEAHVSAAEHGKRLYLALLTRWTGDGEYFRIGDRRNIFHSLHVAHDRAQECPMRSKALQGAGFTADQRDSWLGHLFLAGEDAGVALEYRQQVVHHLAALINVYGPWERAKRTEA